MNTNRITVRYAKALVEAAAQMNLSDEIYSNLSLIFDTMCQYPEFENLITVPGVYTITKMERIKALYKGQLNDLTYRFIELVIRHGRSLYFKDICRNAIALFQSEKNVTTANLELAQMVDPEILDELKSKFEKQIGKQIKMKVVENPSLLGGFVFSVDDEQYDASIKGKLDSLKKKLVN